MTGIAVALLYVALRLVFIYGDTGALPDGTTLTCQTGPDCIYQRYVNAGQANELADLGITDAASLEAATWHELAASGAGLVVLTLGGALVGGVLRGVSSPANLSPPAAAASEPRQPPQERSAAKSIEPPVETRRLVRSADARG